MLLAVIPDETNSNMMPYSKHLHHQEPSTSTRNHAQTQQEPHIDILTTSDDLRHNWLQQGILQLLLSSNTGESVSTTTTSSSPSFLDQQTVSNVPLAPSALTFPLLLQNQARAANSTATLQISSRDDDNSSYHIEQLLSHSHSIPIQLHPSLLILQQPLTLQQQQQQSAQQQLQLQHQQSLHQQQQSVQQQQLLLRQQVHSLQQLLQSFEQQNSHLMQEQVSNPLHSLSHASITGAMPSLLSSSTSPSRHQLPHNISATMQNAWQRLLDQASNPVTISNIIQQQDQQRQPEHQHSHLLHHLQKQQHERQQLQEKEQQQQVQQQFQHQVQHQVQQQLQQQQPLLVPLSNLLQTANMLSMLTSQAGGNAVIHSDQQAQQRADNAFSSATTATTFECNTTMNTSIPGTGERTGRPSITLYLQCDDESLSEYQCLARKQIEIFESNNEDVESTTQGRNRPIVSGQVGIRCRHCKGLSSKDRARGAIYYPSTLNGIYQAAQNMAGRHLCEDCQQIPDSIRQDLVKLRDHKSSAGGGKKYWTTAARVLGVYEDETGCLRFDPG
jgi:hypothetical protein